jgi:hypothetical protein
MATLRATFMTVESRALTGATLQAADLSGATRLADLTTSGASQVMQAVGGGDFVAPAGGIVVFDVSADAVNVAAGAAPVAAATAGVYLRAGLSYAFTIDTGDKIAAINA